MIKFSLTQITFSKYSTLLNFLIRYRQKNLPKTGQYFLFSVFSLLHLKDIMGFYDCEVAWIQMHEHLVFLGKFLCCAVQQNQNLIYELSGSKQHSGWINHDWHLKVFCAVDVISSSERALKCIFSLWRPSGSGCLCNALVLHHWELVETGIAQ